MSRAAHVDVIREAIRLIGRDDMDKRDIVAAKRWASRCLGEIEDELGELYRRRTDDYLASLAAASPSPETSGEQP